jgi:hypothetical protein
MVLEILCHECEKMYCSDAVLNVYKGRKGKAIPLQALTGPESSRGLKLPDVKTIGK